MKRIMALDVGDKRIGIALSDSLQMTASPFDVLSRVEIKGDARKLVKLVADYDVGLIVCGLPLALNGTDSVQTQKVRDFAAYLAQCTDVEMVMWDERLTTVEADDVLSLGGVSAKERKKVIDKVAAAVILRSYLDYIDRQQKR